MPQPVHLDELPFHTKPEVTDSMTASPENHPEAAPENTPEVTPDKSPYRDYAREQYGYAPTTTGCVI